MTQLRIIGTALALIALCATIGVAQTQDAPATSVPGTTVTLAISGPGAINETTIKAGEPVSIDVYWENGDDDRRGFTTGFQITSETIETIVHVADTVKGVNEAGDIKAHNGWEGYTAWDFTGIRAVENDWDGNLPDLIGFGGLRVKNVYNAHENKKVLSWTIVVPEAGSISVDSSFYKPGGIWAIVGPDGVEIAPAWGGPYTFEVVE